MTKQNSYHELVDRLSIFTAHFDSYLLNHQVIQKNSTLKELAENISGTLKELQQSTNTAVEAAEYSNKKKEIQNNTLHQLRYLDSRMV